MPDRNLQVLLIDGKTEDSHWVRELLADFGDNRYGGGWMHGVEIFPIDRLSDAITLLADSGSYQFDAILLNPDLPDSVGLHSLLRLQTCAPAVPILILAELDDQDLAMSMVRAGAQDFLAKNELDSVPLARALRLAVERNKTVRQLRTAAWRDELTGLANRSGFETLAARDLATARRLRQPMACLMVELTGLRQLSQYYGKDEPELALIEVADILRTCVSEAGSLGRVDATKFAIGLPGVDGNEVNLLLSTLRRRFQQYASNATRSCLGLRLGVSRWDGGPGCDLSVILQAADKGLCENMGIILQDTGCKDCHLPEYAHSHRRDV
ncbi:MAG: diguanylate cyclase [Acidobacteria bacterium]|nr:diguanylate cyclase [Acidobacteriota bacterium]